MRLTWKVGAPVFAVLLLSLGLLGFLNVHKFEQLLDNLATARVRVTAVDSKTAIEQSLALGLPLADLQNIQTVIDRAHSFDAAIVSVLVVDLEQTRGEILYASGPRPAQAPAEWMDMQGRAGQGVWHRIDVSGRLTMAWPLIDPLDRTAGMLVFDVSRQRHADMVAVAAAHLAVVVAVLGLVLAGATAIVMLVLLRPVERSIERQASIEAGATETLLGRGSEIARRTVLASSVVMALLCLALSIYAVLLFEEQLTPEVDAKSLAVARSLQQAIDRATGYGIPLADLQGMDAFLGEAIGENGELARIVVADDDGSPLFVRGEVTGAGSARELRQPLAQAQGTLSLWVRADYARNKLLEVLVDTAIVLFVALLLAFELLPYIVHRGLGRHLAALAATLGMSGAAYARNASPTDIRVPMFVFVLAEQLCTSFFPLYVRDLYVPIPGLSEQAAIGLPIALFMLFVALGTVFGGNLIGRAGAVRVFRWGVVLTAGGYLGLALAHNIYDLLLWRILTAVGYALSTLACQAYVVETTTAEKRTRAMSVFVGAVMVAAVCGSALGGVLADLVGYRSVFGGALLLALLSLSAFPGMSPREASKLPREDAEQALSIAASYRILATDRGFAAVMLLASIPAKLLFTGAVFFFTPLYLGNLGFDTATIGRCIMVYYLPMAFATPLTAWIADRYRLRLSLVVGGGLIAGLGGVAALFLQGIPAVLVAMAGLGIGQVLATAPTFSLALAAGEAGVRQVGQANALAAIRVLERIGSVAGPLFAGMLIVVAGYEKALAVLGGIVLAAALLLPLALRSTPAEGRA